MNLLSNVFGNFFSYQYMLETTVHVGQKMPTHSPPGLWKQIAHPISSMIGPSKKLVFLFSNMYKIKAK